MKRRLSQIILIQLATIAIFTVFVAELRFTYREAISEAGQEVGKLNALDILHEAEVELSDEVHASIFPNKDKIIGPAFIELRQYALYVAPIILLQCTAIMLALSAGRKIRTESNTEYINK